jgi:hypothetical protein
MRHELVSNGSVGRDHSLTIKPVPFQVPENIARIDVSYSYDAAISPDPKSAVETGGHRYLRSARRGWSDSERLEFFITADEASSGHL